MNRTRTEIIVEALQSLEASPKLRTYVMYRARLSYTQLKYYEEILSEKGLMDEIDGKWTITKKGREYLEAWARVEEVLQT